MSIVVWNQAECTQAPGYGEQVVVTNSMTPASESIGDLRMAVPNVVSIRSDPDIIAARMAARDLARSMGFNAIDQARIATATSELARNIYMYAREGRVIINQVHANNRDGIEIIFEDQGPGIVDIASFLHDGATTTGKTGMGLFGSRRLMDELEVETAQGIGTKIICRKWLR